MGMTWNPAVGVPMLIIGIIVLVAVWLFGQPRKPGQGSRKAEAGRGRRREPVLGDPAGHGADAHDPDVVDDIDVGEDPVTLSAEATESPEQGELDVSLRDELERLGRALSGDRQQGPASDDDHASGRSAPVAADPQIGARPAELAVDRIVTLFVVAQDGDRFRGSDLVVAAEKVGLEFGAMDIFHRLLDGKPEAGPVFSVANMVKPGNFDMSRIGAVDTPGLSMFMTLPGPMTALDAWDAMLPTAQRLAELLDGLVLDEEHNALGRQRIAHIRDGLRAWDRRHEGDRISFDR
jgi:cell division protein ZipA